MDTNDNALYEYEELYFMKNMPEAMIHVLEKPDWLSWDEIHNVLWKAHAQNREKGMNMALPALPGEKIREKIEGHGKMLVAIWDDKIVGTAAIKVKHVNLWCGKGEYAYCCFASVLSDYSGTGIYKKLNLEREKIAREMGFARMLFDTHEDNERVLDVNKKNGYTPVDISIWQDHYNVIMVKWLDGCPFPDWYCTMQFFIHKWYRKLRFKPGRIKRFGI